MILTKKKDDSMRFVIDYRRLNDVSNRDQYPMPNIKDLMDDLEGAKLFSCMDLPSAYWHVPMEKSSIEKTAFEVPGGKYEMLRMPFGLKNSQSTQQRLMDRVLGKIPKTSTYVDNILTHAVTTGEQFRNLEAIFTQLQDSNLSLRIDKCEFLRESVEQFGFIVDKHGLRPTGDGVRKINMYPTPSNAKEVKRFLGMANYYREFVPKFSEMAEPIHQVLRGGTSFVWTPERESAFTAIKREIARSCNLNFPDWNKPFVVELDCSKVAACGVLMQKGDNGETRILGYHSSTLDAAQKRYCATEMECWAAISAMRKFRVYVKGAPQVFLISDHEPLQWLRKQKDPRGKFARWIIELEQYDYVFKHKPGREIVGPDALSRIETSKEPTDGEDNEYFEQHIYRSDVKDVGGPDDWKRLLREEQAKDPTIETARQQLMSENNIKQGRFKNFGQMFLHDNLVVKSGRILVPNSLKYQITRDFHESDHWGAANTYRDAAKKYYWPNMKRYISEYVDSCDVCSKTKHSNTKPRAYLKPQNWAKYFPRQAIALDLATMVRSRDGYKYILLITDGMSKYVELCPLRDITANAVTTQISRQWIARHGAPESLLTDQGQQVDGTDVRELCARYNIQKKRSSPYHPEGDGISERQIGTMKGLFRAKLSSEHLPANRWTEILADVQLAMNNKTHAATKHTPAELMFGDNRLRTGATSTTVDQDYQTPDCATSNQAEETGFQKRRMIGDAQANLQYAAYRMKKSYDENVHEQVITAGDQVFLKKNAVKKGESRKLSPLFHNLSEVLEVNMPLLKIRNMANGSVQWRHHNQLKKRNVRPLADSREIRVRFKGTTTMNNITGTNGQTDQRRTRGNNKSLVATQATTHDYTHDYDDECPLELPNDTQSNHNLLPFNMSDNDQIGGAGSSTNGSEQRPAEAQNIGEGAATDDSSIDALPFRNDPTVADSTTSDGQSSAQHESSSNARPGRLPGPSRKTIRNQNLLRNFGRRRNMDAPSSEISAEHGASPELNS